MQCIRVILNFIFLAGTVSIFCFTYIQMNNYYVKVATFLIDRDSNLFGENKYIVLVINL